MKNFFLLKSLSVFLLIGSLFASCSKDDVKNESPVILSSSDILCSTAWQTSGAKNEAGETIALTDPSVANFLGYSYFQKNGNFAGFSPDNKPKMNGTWSISSNGKTRTLVTPTFTRVVDITVLTEREFTYRIYPNPSDRTKYLDIIHTPTTNVRPSFPSEILSSTRWVTSNAKNEKGENMPLTDPRVASYVGYSSFNINGDFSIFNLDNSLRVSGTWSISADGKTRTLVTPAFTRTVEITVLTKSEFTYRTYPVNGNRVEYIDIIHTPVKFTVL